MVASLKTISRGAKSFLPRGRLPRKDFLGWEIFPVPRGDPVFAAAAASRPGRRRRAGPGLVSPPRCRSPDGLCTAFPRRVATVKARFRFVLAGDCGCAGLPRGAAFLLAAPPPPPE